MREPEIRWIAEFDFGRSRVLQLWIPLDWYIEQKSPRIALAKIAWWLVKMAWRVLTTGNLFKEIK